MPLALFDFDGTITKKDSLLHFIRFVKGNFKTLLGIFLLFPMLVKFKLGFLPNDQAKQKVMAYFFKGISSEDFKRLATDYSLNKIHSILRPKALERIQWHQKEGHRIVVVSASIKEWLEPWCDQNDLELICTELEYKEGRLTGNFSLKNCHGQEKVNRIKSRIDLNEYDDIYAYGDSSGDTEMLALAHYKHYRYF